MALTTAGIQQVRNSLGKIYTNEKKMTDLMQITAFMQNDQNFNAFIQGTKFGQETYQKWKDLVGLISGDLHQCLTNIERATDAFINSQEENNSRGYHNNSSDVYSSGSSTLSTSERFSSSANSSNVGRVSWY